MKFRNILCNLSTLLSLYATIKNVSMRPKTADYNLLSGSNRSADRRQMTSSTSKSVTRNSTTVSLVDTTVIISSNYIPSLPSTDVIDQTIESLSFLRGLDQTSSRIPLFITVDGPYGKERGPNSPRQRKLTQYTTKLRTKYANHSTFNVTVLPQTVNVRLIKNIQHALKFVQTPFVYILQHDLPFLLPVNHSFLIDAFQKNPDNVRLVRFGLHKVLGRHRDIPPDAAACEERFFSSQDGMLHLTKTHIWSDNNHFTTKAYYEEMLSTVPGFDKANFMEVPMREMAQGNCKKWGTWLYGEIGHGPMIHHLDGKRYDNSNQNNFDRRRVLDHS